MTAPLPDPLAAAEAGRELRSELKPLLARALLNENEAGGGCFDDLADAVLDCLAYEKVALIRAASPDPLADYRDRITVTFERRPDGGLRVYSDELPGLALSHADHAAVLADLRPAIEGLMSHRLTAAETERDALRANGDRLRKQRRTAIRYAVDSIRSSDKAHRELVEIEAERDALRARAERAEKALRPFAALVPSTLHPADGSDAEGYSYVLAHPADDADFTGEDLARARAALAQHDPAEEG